MRSNALFVLVCRLGCALLLAPAVAWAQPNPDLHPALWKISQANTTIWLFGSVHMLAPNTPWLNGAVADAADQATELVTETAEPDRKALGALIEARSTLPPGDTLAKLLTPDQRFDLGERLARFGLGPTRFDTNQPWFAAVVLSTLPLLARGFSEHDGVEAALTARMAARGVGRSGIETPADQIEALAGLPRATQVSYLLNVIADFDKINGQVDGMIAAWGKGDAATLARLMRADAARDDPVMTQRLIQDRNQRFAAWILARLRQPGKVLVVIGAMHLAGSQSVIDSLARSGIRVERVQ